VLQLRFIEARPACILCFAAGENVIFHFPGSNSKKNSLTIPLNDKFYLPFLNDRTVKGVSLRVLSTH
jgi:hypothetical protein